MLFFETKGCVRSPGRTGMSIPENLPQQGATLRTDRVSPELRIYIRAVWSSNGYYSNLCSNINWEIRILWSPTPRGTTRIDAYPLSPRASWTAYLPSPGASLGRPPDKTRRSDPHPACSCRSCRYDWTISIFVHFLFWQMVYVPKTSAQERR